MAPSKVFGRIGGHGGPQSDTCPETSTAADSDSEAHSGPCCEGLRPASQPLLVPPQRRGGRAGSPISTSSEPSCAPVPTDIVRVV